MYKLTRFGDIQRISDGAVIPQDVSNPHFVTYTRWLADGNMPEPFIAPQITEVSMRQFRAALIITGHSDPSNIIDYIALVDAAIAAMSGVDKLLAENDWLTAGSVRIDYPLVLSMVQFFAWTDAQVQALFDLANTK